MDACTAGEAAAQGGPLDLHEGISDPRAHGCPRWPEHLGLLNHSTGELVPGRCRATNLCSYCAKLAAVENAELLALDAAEYAPTLWIVLTTRTADVDPKRFYRSREAVWKAVRRRWPDAEYAFLVEFTTGYGIRSGGLRRPHWNLLVKGVPVEQADELRRVVVERWCAREDAEPEAQYVGAIAETGGLMRYLALHFQKESQAPPRGWRGHRFRTSSGYLVRPAAELRQEAKHSLRLKRLLHRGHELEEAEQALALAEVTEWSLRYANPSTVEFQGRKASVVPAVDDAASRAAVDTPTEAGLAVPARTPTPHGPRPPAARAQPASTAAGGRARTACRPPVALGSPP